MSDTIPEVVAFIARHWGGEGVVPRRRPATRSRRDVDGGSYRIPAGWIFHADGFTYQVFRKDGLWQWTDGTPWGSFATLADDGDHWIIQGWGDPQRVRKDRYAAASTLCEGCGEEGGNHAADCHTWGDPEDWL